MSTPWTPSPEFEQHVHRLIVRATEEARAKETREGDEAFERLTARGLGRSGAALSDREKRAMSALDEAGHRAIRETLTAMTSVFSRVTPGMTTWLRGKLLDFLEGHAAGRARALEEGRQRMGVSAAGLHEDFQRVASALKRDLEIELQPIEMRARLAAIASDERPRSERVLHDVFMSHASEDKDSAAVPLTEALKARGLSVWMDDDEVALGSTAYTKIDEGLASSRFGVVILSPTFLAKRWTRRELAALAALGDAEGEDKILPVLHNIERQELSKASPLLGALHSARLADGFEAVADEIAAHVARVRGR